VPFETISGITDVEVMPPTRNIREVARLRKQYGPGRWRKVKGRATALLSDGTARVAEIHWYEASGIGRKELKIKRFLD
jgi:hypothetical protein